jgi:hypothetical protein
VADFDVAVVLVLALLVPAEDLGDVLVGLRVLALQPLQPPLRLLHVHHLSTHTPNYYEPTQTELPQNHPPHHRPPSTPPQFISLPTASQYPTFLSLRRFLFTFNNKMALLICFLHGLLVEAVINRETRVRRKVKLIQQYTSNCRTIRYLISCNF